MAEKDATQTPKIAELKRRIAADPASRSFLELAREYYEAGLFEMAATVCTQGLKYHPHYVSARVLLGRVCFDSGLLDEARSHMETVLAAVPDNLVARRVVAETCRIQGDLPGALERFSALLAFNPRDEETRKRILEIEALMGAPAAASVPRQQPPASKEELGTHEPVISLQPAISHEPVASHERASSTEPVVLEEIPAPEAAPLATPTLAEIYLQQGLPQKAIEVYHEILKGDPENLEAIWRLSELEPRPQPPPDPEALLAARKIAVLNGWLKAVRGQARA